MRPSSPCRRSPLALAALLAAPLGAGCAGAGGAHEQWLAEGCAAYERRDFAAAAESTSMILRQSDRGPEAARALYVRGVSHMRGGRRPQAALDLRRCVELGSDSEASWRAAVTLGTLYYEDGRWEDARRALAVAASRMPPGPPADLILFRLGVCLERSARWEDARRAFAQVAERFAGTEPGAWARRRLQLAAEHFAVQCGVFSQPANAERMVDALKSRGFEAYVRSEARGAQSVQTVLVGRYASYDQMLRQLGAVRRVEPNAVPWP